MRRTIKTLIAALLISVVPASLAISTVYAACPSSNTAQGQVIEGISETGSNCETSGLTNAISTVVEILSFIVGIVAVIVVIYSGLKYITAAGDSGKISNAKNTLIYALVGLAIAGVAQLLVHFVLHQSGTAADPPPCQQGYSRPANSSKCVKDS